MTQSIQTMTRARAGSGDLTEQISAAAGRILDGGLVAFPTETVYGLGADATNQGAVARIFTTKNRPEFNPLIVHVETRDAAEHIAVFSEAATRLADTFWPGPLTLVLPAKPSHPVAPNVTAGLSTIAIRVPAHPVAKALLEAVGKPVAAPSANRSGRVSPTRAAHVTTEFESDTVMLLDGGPSISGLESTIVDVSGNEPVLLRPGTITREQIEAALGIPLTDPHEDAPAAPAAPGQLVSHYAPRAAVRLNASAPNTNEAWLAFGLTTKNSARHAENLSPTGDLAEAAANLFDALRKLDQADIDTIAVMPIPDHGIGEAINDRLRRAAAPRGKKS